MTLTHCFEGGCHCGNLSFVFEASAGLDVLGLRADQCSFCRAHRARTTSDPNGSVRIAVRDSRNLSRYRFGLGITDFLICAHCGVFIGAVMEDGESTLMTISANALRPRPPDDFPVSPVDFDDEDIPARIARRKLKWTPVVAFEVSS